VTAAALERVQAHVLRPAHAHLTCSAFYFVKIDEPAGVRDLLRRLLDTPMTVSDAEARRQASQPPDHPYVAVGFTRPGLKLLGREYCATPTQVAGGETDPFSDGMTARRALLDDPDTSSWPGSGCHMLLWVADVADRSYRQAVDDLLERSHVSPPHVEEGCRAEGGAVVLGFRDGTSQPFVSELASRDDRLPGGGTVTPDGWRPVPLGEFVLGSTDAGEERLLPDPVSVTNGGTFLVYRKYVFDHQAFDAFLEDAGREYERVMGWDEGGCATVAAKFLGRYRQGESPPGGPEGYDAVIPAGTSPDTIPSGPNDFRYGSDTLGHSCPLGAHIRRANPRDALGFDGRLTVRHRIIRRGVPWHEGADQGLHFVGVNARIQDQFEFIQRQWLNTGSALRLGGDVDLIAGSSPQSNEGSGEQAVRFVIQGTDPVILSVPRPFTRLLGGDYFLMPGMEGLEQLARGSA
jgi:deferrochelatase/peroxidase EfeB